MSTIAAISTPNAPGGIAVIRVSGENAIAVSEAVFTPFGGKKVGDMPGYTCAYGIAGDKDGRIDDCILTVFRAPHSYTGEDVCEISCHGGIYVSRKILRALLNNGAEPAQAGEFTKRAFLNGKLDLTSAEAVMDVISAKSELELKMAEQLREGAAFRKAKECSGKLLALLSGLAAWTDYPDEDIPEVQPEHMIGELRAVRSTLQSLINGYDSGRIIREGIPAAIVGRPNVGKSTLFNCLSGCERSIVTEIAGTTRDVVEETIRLGDIVLRLSDTAGIHETDDKIEGIGIGHAQKLIDTSELIIAVFDGSCPLTADDFSLLESLKGRKVVAVINKTDEELKIEEDYITQLIIHTVYISAKENDGVDKLQAAVEELFSISRDSFGSATAANERQKKCIDSALASVDEAISAIESCLNLDAVNIILDEAEQHLLELTGEKITDAVVDEVFSRFCVGK